MATFTLKAPKLCGIVTALPTTVEENADLADVFGADTIAKIIKATGIERRPVAKHLTISDLGFAAADALLAYIGWARDSIELLVVVTQTPDYPLPSTACVLQHRLGLPAKTMVYDLNLGCSGYVYGLSNVTAMMQSAGFNRALLVAGDITTSMIGPEDRTLRPLFGDAVAVTALELSDDHMISFDLGSDGAGAPYLISHSGGMVKSGAPELFMDGTQVMAFSLKQVAPSVARALTAAGAGIGDMSHVVLHQANAMMLKTLGHKMGARDDQLVVALRDYGNTSSASIPLALCEALCKTPSFRTLNLLLCGFGVGWSWGSAVWMTQPPLYCDIIRVTE